MSGPPGAEHAGGFPRIDSHQYFTPEYLPSLLFPILKRNRFDGSVVVVSRPSLEETRWLLELAAAHDFIRAVVGWADLADPQQTAGKVGEPAYDNALVDCDLATGSCAVGEPNPARKWTRWVTNPSR